MEQIFNIYRVAIDQFTNLSGSDTFYWGDLLENYSVIIYSFSQYKWMIYYIDTALTSQSLQFDGRANRCNQSIPLKMHQQMVITSWLFVVPYALTNSV